MVGVARRAVAGLRVEVVPDGAADVPDVRLEVAEALAKARRVRLIQRLDRAFGAELERLAQRVTGEFGAAVDPVELIGREGLKRGLHDLLFSRWRATRGLNPSSDFRVAGCLLEPANRLLGATAGTAVRLCRGPDSRGGARRRLARPWSGGGRR